jgi:thiaminase/transcriptional activator TenA
MQSFAQNALGAIAVEQALHGRYLRDFGVDPIGIADAEPSPDCLAYTSYLIAAAYHEPWEVLVAALLPCFWLYWEVGCAIARAAAPENPAPGRTTLPVDPVSATCGRLSRLPIGRQLPTAAATRAKMLAAFVRACQYEWLFWDGAHRSRRLAADRLTRPGQPAIGSQRNPSSHTVDVSDRWRGKCIVQHKVLESQ